MAQFTIPVVQGSAAYRMRVPLDGVDFLLDFAWNERAGAWFLSVFSSDETPLVQGVKIVSNRPLLHRFRYVEGMPAGDLFAADFTGAVPYPSYSQLGADVELFYLDADELGGI